MKLLRIQRNMQDFPEIFQLFQRQKKAPPLTGGAFFEVAGEQGFEP
ncbi:MAG: hypothetical protein PSX71_02090 [bacterium]|nr:hypothetical protein [bacterium]